jgi:hypothetical protein
MGDRNRPRTEYAPISDEFQSLLNYFGKPILDVIGLNIPAKPKNPMYSVPSNLAGSIAETRQDYQIKKKEGK